MRPRALQPMAVALVLLAALLLPACSRQGRPLQPVRGQVFFQNRPAPGALVVFHPADTDDPQAPRPSGRVGEDGSFSVKTFPHGDGAPPGEYDVAVVWIESTDAANPKTGQVPNRLPDRYGDPRTSGLRVRVAEGANELPPFSLTR